MVWKMYVSGADSARVPSLQIRGKLWPFFKPSVVDLVFTFEFIFPLLNVATYKHKHKHKHAPENNELRNQDKS